MGTRLEGKTALVFGAGSDGTGWSNGQAVAVQYAREGARVMVVDRDQAAAERTARIIRGEGHACIQQAADVTNIDDVLRVVEGALEQFGRIDILHNNVGATTMGGLPELSLDNWQKAIEVNLTSVFLTMKLVLPSMVANQYGAIINISSIAGIRYTGYPYPAYSATKAAVNHLTQVIALQYAPYNIRVNAILPGLIDTPLIYRQIAHEYDSVDDMVAARNAQSPLGRMGTAWDVAYASVFLASDEAGFITGVCLPVDGGQTARSL